MVAITPVTQQMVQPELGEYKAERSCSPACFYMLGSASGYDMGSFTQFIADLPWETVFTAEMGWMRPKLAEALRQKYGMTIISWRVDGNHDGSDETIERMRAASYLQTEREVTFYRKHVIGKTVEDLVRAGYPVILGMRPSFGPNLAAHAILVAGWNDSGVTIIDPDARNTQSHYAADYVRSYVNPTGGGCTIVLPPEK